MKRTTGDHINLQKEFLKQASEYLSKQLKYTVVIKEMTRDSFLCTFNTTGKDVTFQYMCQGSFLVLIGPNGKYAIDSTPCTVNIDKEEFKKCFPPEWNLTTCFNFLGCFFKNNHIFNVDHGNNFGMTLFDSYQRDINLVIDLFKTN